MRWCERETLCLLWERCCVLRSWDLLLYVFVKLIRKKNDEICFKKPKVYHFGQANFWTKRTMNLLCVHIIVSYSSKSNTTSFQKINEIHMLCILMCTFTMYTILHNSYWLFYFVHMYLLKCVHMMARCMCTHLSLSSPKKQIFQKNKNPLIFSHFTLPLTNHHDYHL